MRIYIESTIPMEERSREFAEKGNELYAKA
jgi:hypothetical protein